MPTKAKQKRYKNYLFWGLFLTISGIVLIGMGLFSYIFGTPSRGINLATQQPVIIDGTKTILGGIIALLAGIYRLVFRKRAFDEEEEIRLQDNKEEYEKHLKKKGLSRKEINKRIKELKNNKPPEQRY